MESMKLVLIEDDSNECENFRKISKRRNDIEFSLITNSDIEGLKYLKENEVDGVILDLELNKGSGNSNAFPFIEEVNKLKFKNAPKIVVTTNVYSDSVYDFLHNNGIDLIFYKKQENYFRENVINTLLLLKGYNNNRTSGVNIPTKEEANNKISEMINKELDLIGISTHLQGRKYFFDSIYCVLEDESASPMQYLIKKYKKSNSTITRAMQNAILHAWRISAIDDLEKLYTARINYETGVPTPTEFIYYYKDKIKKEL